MSYVITKTINERFVYWWNRDKKRWEGLKSNASSFKSEAELNEAIASIRKLNLYDKSVHCKFYKKTLKGQTI